MAKVIMTTVSSSYAWQWRRVRNSLLMRMIIINDIYSLNAQLDYIVNSLLATVK
ncbi:hypothetical protein ACFORK_06480 [Paenibacillus sp. GCM10012306]